MAKNWEHFFNNAYAYNDAKGYMSDELINELESESIDMNSASADDQYTSLQSDVDAVCAAIEYDRMIVDHIAETRYCYE